MGPTLWDQLGPSVNRSIWGRGTQAFRHLPDQSSGRFDGPSETVILSASVLGGQDQVRLHTEPSILYVSLEPCPAAAVTPAPALWPKDTVCHPRSVPSLQMPLPGLGGQGNRADTGQNPFLASAPTLCGSGRCEKRDVFALVTPP